MFTNAFVQTYLSIHYAATIGGNQLTYDVTDGVDYNITYEGQETFYQCSGKAHKFTIFDPHFFATRTERHSINFDFLDLIITSTTVQLVRNNQR